MTAPKKKVLDPNRTVPPSGGSGAVPPREPERMWLTIERKYRVAAYESLSVSIGVSSSVDPGETFGSTTRWVFGELREEFNDIVEIMRGDEGV